MSENAAKPNAFINGSIIIAVYFIFWVIVTVVLPIISIGLRLYSKESQIKKDQAPNTLQDS
jgi:predicted secreted protein